MTQLQVMSRGQLVPLEVLDYTSPYSGARQQTFVYAIPSSSGLTVYVPEEEETWHTTRNCIVTVCVVDGVQDDYADITAEYGAPNGAILWRVPLVELEAWETALDTAAYLEGIVTYW